MAVKGVEWQAKFGHGLFPGGTELEALPAGQQIFFGLYFITTGLHSLHVLVGAALLLWTFGLTGRGQVTAQNPVLLENSALYWHLVDLIWIFIFPLYYLLL
ncbi:MAG: cytochrome c oxidase subunit 3 [Syntrophotaleaceae bacterium]